MGVAVTFPGNVSNKAERLLALCRERGLRVATAESCTGGLIAACLTEIAGSSDVVDRGFVTYSNEAKHDLLGVPEALLAHREAPFISFARFKGPTRLAVANLFGLIPDVLRTAWHGPNVAHFARVCCDVAKLYGCLFQMYGMVEGLHAAVRWTRRGLYRSRWGNYDLIPHPGLVTFSRDLAVADVLASRLQGRRVDDSAFFQVVRQKLGFPEQTARLPIPEDLVLRLV